MPEKLEELVRAALVTAQSEGELPEFDVADMGFERPADSTNGDWSSTVAMRSARLAHCAPAKIAASIVAHLPEDPAVAKVEVAGPGFINFYLNAASANDIFRVVRESGDDFARSAMGAGKKIQIEFVSANPVGPLHIGHGRWAALGDSLCNVLERAGYDVEREYYINDHGSQMDVFGHSISKRYLQLLELMGQGKSCDEAVAVLLADREAYVADEQDEAPETHPFTDAFNKALGGNAYAGDYIVDLAARFVASDGDSLAGADEDERCASFRERGYNMMLESIRETCHAARCDFDVWFSERSLYEKGPEGTSAVDRALAKLDELGYLFRDEAGALWFRSTEFGDDKDRVLIKTNGEYTYFASDVAYHWDKFQRVDHVIDLWGADHHGYIKRCEAMLAAWGYPGALEVVLGQLVNLFRDGEAVRMSKRTGEMVTFAELIDEVGVDATRFLMLSRSSDQPIDFDIEVAKKKDNSNPVYYVQYAHARICSVLRKAAGEGAEDLSADELAAKVIPADVDLSPLTHESEIALMRKMDDFGELAARDRAPFRLTHYAQELAGLFHQFYTNCHIIGEEPAVQNARLALADAARTVLALTLSLIGVSAPERM